MIPEQEAPVPHEEPEILQLCLYHKIMRAMRKICSGWRMALMIWTMTQMKATLTWMRGFLKMGVIIGIESSSPSLKFWFKKKFLGFV
jgi:hypothetical protein